MAEAPNNGGVTGTIDNFMANEQAVPWSVSLMRAGWGANGAITAPADVGTTNVDESLGTVWSIDGNSAARSGTWSGQMWDEMPGDTDAMPPGDGSTIPTTTTGTFQSTFGSTHTMVGAFGADKQ